MVNVSFGYGSIQFTLTLRVDVHVPFYSPISTAQINREPNIITATRISPIPNPCTE